MERGLELGRYVGHPLARVPGGRVEADRVHADEHLTRSRFGNRRLLVTHHLGAAEFVKPDRTPRLCRHHFLLPALRDTLIRTSDPCIRTTDPNIWTSGPNSQEGQMRADARKNHEHLLAVAGAASTEQGVDVA